MKKLKLPLLVLIFPYIYLLVFLYNSLKVGLSLSLITWGFVVIVYIPNIIYVFVIAKRGVNSTVLLFWDMVLKLCNIPIFIVVFVFGFVFAVIPAGIVLSLFLAIFDYIILLPSSIYGVGGLLQARRERKITTATTIVNVILHFFFCLDVISAIVMYRVVKSKDEVET